VSLRGIDVSANNGPIDWDAVKRAHVAFAFAKATEGVSYVDPHLHDNRDGAGRVRIPLGLYHFARPDTHPTIAGARDEARHFARQVGKLRASDLLPVLDLERELPLGHGPAQLEAWARAFSQETRKLLGRFPLFYSYPAMIDGLRLHRPIGSGLWLASYGTDDGREHPAEPPHPWKRTLVHQYTSQGHVPGVSGRIDLNDAGDLEPIRARGKIRRAVLLRR
jgi:GH25 family lysozyme M1 (1,4-beta-N-acetylmuramidase)